MHDTTENALVEIGLALAMAFFALLVVALVAVAAPAARSNEAAAPAPRFDAPTLALQSGAAPAAEAGPRFLLHHRGRWYDAAGQNVSPAALSADSAPVVVALAPTASLAAAQAALAEVAHLSSGSAPTLTPLPPEWIDRLEARP